MSVAVVADSSDTRVNVNDIDRTVEDCGMAWKTPKIVEISLGAEINCYACAELS